MRNEIGIARELIQKGEIEQAVALLERTVSTAPLDSDLQQALCEAHQSAQNQLEASLAQATANALRKGNASALYTVATMWFAHGKLDQAERGYQTTLCIDPGFAAAHEKLAAVYHAQGRADEAANQLREAYSKQWIFIEEAPAHAPNIVLFYHSGRGHIPVTHLLPLNQYRHVRCMLDFARPAELHQLPIDGVVFNVIGDPDWAEASHAHLSDLLSTLPNPILNKPDAIPPTRRDRLPATLSGIDHVLVPQVERIALDQQGTSALADAIDMRGACFPLVLRPAGSHGGQGVILANTRADVLAASLGNADIVYATQFHDSRGQDGHYRKYRIIYVDRQPYPYHLAISTQWLVHYFSAEMHDKRWKLEEEMAFLTQPQATLGDAAWQAIQEIGKQLDLDYCGIDFSIMPDGRLIVFEANATMQIHPEAANGPLAHKNPYIDKIIQAFGDMISKHVPAKKY